MDWWNVDCRDLDRICDSTSFPSSIYTPLLRWTPATGAGGYSATTVLQFGITYLCKKTLWERLTSQVNLRLSETLNHTKSQSQVISQSISFHLPKSKSLPPHKFQPCRWRVAKFRIFVQKCGEWETQKCQISLISDTTLG
jgi:hypothetical protein